MAKLLTYQLTVEDMEINATRAGHMLINHLVHHGYLTKEQGTELKLTRQVILRKPSFLKNVFDNLMGKEGEPYQMHVAVLDHIGNGEEHSSEDDGS